MKKIFMLGLLITPIAANATDRVGPEPFDGGWEGLFVQADDVAPYQTAEILPSDATQVVSASYVKGAYNDTIAAINSLGWDVEYVITELADKQRKLEYMDGGVRKNIFNSVETSLDISSNILRGSLVTGQAVKNAVDAVSTTVSNKRVNALATWGSDSVTQLELANLPAGN